MAKTDAKVVLYAVDMGELKEWIGCKDPKRFQEAWAAVRDDEDSDWEPEEREVLERLLRRLVFDGELYEGIQEQERYYLTQILIDLFDEYVDQEPLSEDMPLDRLQQAAGELGRNAEATRMLNWLLRGRELDRDENVWTSGPVEDVLSYFGYVTRDEAPRFVAALDAAMQSSRSRPSGLLKQLRSAADECARAELDLVSFVG